MNPNYEIIYHPDVVEKDLPYISNEIKLRIRKTIETKLFFAPEEFGEPLRRTLKGYWKLRVGDYRIIYRVSQKIVTIFKIGHRREIYKNFKEEI